LEPVLPRHKQDINTVGDFQTSESTKNCVHERSNSSSTPENSKKHSRDNAQHKDFALMSHNSKEVYWCVDKPWTELQETMLSVLPNTQDIEDDAEFYKKLNAEYIRTRGQLRHHLFSWKTCVSIEFIKVSKSIYRFYTALTYPLVSPGAQ
jgi:hypothetical protein